MLKKLFGKLSKKKTIEEEISDILSSDEEIVGNTSKLCRSINLSMARCMFETLCPDADFESLSEEEKDEFAEYGYILYWIGRGFHVTEADLEQLK